MIKVSIIMPSLNVGSYIDEAVNSVRNQSLKEIEIICIDAGSSDGTWEKLQAHSKADARITLIKSPRKSYGYQVNLGISMARGRYLAILETDDHADKNMYETLYRAARTADCDYAKADYFAFWTQNNGERVFLKRRNLEDERLYGKVLYPAEYPVLGQNDWYLWTGIYKREFLIRNQIRMSETPGAAFQDIGFLIETQQAAEKAVYIDQALYRYCLDREDASSNQGKGLIYSYQEFAAKIGEKRTEKGKQELFFARMAKSFVCCASELKEEPQGELQDYFEWFRTMLGYAAADHKIALDFLADWIWNQTKGLIAEGYAFLGKKREQRNRFLNTVKTEENRIPVVIFGCGNIGYEAYRWAQKEALFVIGFMDNDRALQGSRLNGIPVFPPQEVPQLPADTHYMIANEKSAGQIQAQLCAFGVSEERIYQYR